MTTDNTPQSERPDNSEAAADFQHILVPLDGSSLAEVVLETAFFLAGQLGATVTLLHVMEHDAPGEVHGESHLQDQQEATEYLRGLSERAAAEGITVEWHVHPNPEHDVAGSIASHADELGADLVIMATHGQSGLRELLLGSIAQEVLRRGDQPVLLLRPGGMPFAGRRVAVALDGSSEGEAAIPVARDLATRVGAELALLSVVPTIRTIEGGEIATATFMPSATSELLEIEAEERQEYLARLAAELTLSSEHPVIIALRRGDIVGELANAVREIEADLVVMSTHARRHVGAFLSGSIGPRLISQVRRPILLVRLSRES